MKIVELIVKNFRQFYGEQKIKFSEHDDKNITLIHGENNGGKTALLNAMLWCMYGKTSHNFQNPKNLLNKYAATQNDRSYNVRMTFNHPSPDDHKEMEVFEIIRSKDNLRVLKKIGYSCLDIKNPQYFINTILPVDMANHFFYQGEGSGTLNETTSFQNIRKSIEEILGVSVAEKTVEDLKKIQRNYEIEKTKLDKTGESERFEKDKQNKEKQLASLVINFDDADMQVGVSKFSMDEIVTKLLNSDSQVVKEKEQRRKNLSDLLDHSKKELQQANNNKNNIVRNKGLNAFTSRLSSIDLQNINTNELNLKHPFTISKSLLHEIIKESKCICGSNVNGDKENKIKELLTEAVDPVLRERWKKIEILTLSLSENKNKLQNAVISILKSKVSADSNISKYQTELEEISAELRNLTDLQDVNKLENDRRLHEANYEKAVSQKARFEREIESVQRDIITLEQKLMNTNRFEPAMAKFSNYSDSVSLLIELIASELESAKKDIYARILMRMNKFLTAVSWQGYQARLDGSNIRLVDNNGLPADTGNGFQTMLAVSFIISLIYLAKMRSRAAEAVLTTGTVAPFIADAPFGYLSHQNSKSMAEHIAESVDQVVFLLSTTHWTEYVDSGIKPKIGREYNLVQHTTLSEDQFKEEHSTTFLIAGIKYDVVRFEAQFEHVTIEEVIRDE